MATVNPKVAIFARMIREIDGYQAFLEEVSKKDLPTYKPIRRSDSEGLTPDAQKNNWVFDSGVLKENARILKLLTGESK